MLFGVAVIDRRMFYDDVPILFPHTLGEGADLGRWRGGAAKANDTSAKLDMGALWPIHNDSIEMQEEDFYLSQKEVRVRYRFFNKSSSDIETLVAFPLPKIEIYDGINYSAKIAESSDPVNFIDFQVITSSVDARVSSMGVDITPLLAKHGLPITKFRRSEKKGNSEIYDRLEKLSEPALRELERSGALDPEGFPHWTAHLTFYWFQSFPAERAIEVTHRYKPVPFEFLTTSEQISSDARMRKDYCSMRPSWRARDEGKTKSTTDGICCMAWNCAMSSAQRRIGTARSAHSG